MKQKHIPYTNEQRDTLAKLVRSHKRNGRTDWKAVESDPSLIPVVAAILAGYPTAAVQSPVEE